MRSTKGKATRFLLKRHLFIAVIVFLVTFYLMPVWGLSHLEYAKELAARPEAQQLAEEISRSVSVWVMTVPLNLEMMVMLYGGMGFLTAMMLMSPLFSRKRSMMQAALPDRRETEYLRRCAAYVVLCLAPIVVNFLLYLLVVAANGLIGYVAWGKLLSKFGMLLLINTYGFAMGMLSSVLTGTFWAALLSGGVLIVGAEAFIYLWYSIATKYLHTLVKDSLTGIGRLSPAYMLYKGFYRPGEYSVLPGIVAIALALGLSFWLYRIRRTERAEHTLAFSPLHTVLGIALPMLGGSALGVVIYLSFTTEISMIVGMLVGVVLTFWVCRIVFNQRLCGIRRQWYLPTAAAALLMLGVVTLHHDLLGFDSFLPERGKLTAISFVQRYDDSEAFTLTSQEAMDAAYDWCMKMRDETISQKEWPSRGSSDMVVTYQMGGRKVYRHYPNDLARTEAQDSLKTILESADYRQSLIDYNRLDTGDVTWMGIYPANSVLRMDSFFERFGVRTLDRSYNRAKDSLELDKLTAALKADVLARTFADKQEDAILKIGMDVRDGNSGNELYRQLSVYPGDMHTLKLLFGEKAEAIVDYARGGFAEEENIVVLKVAYNQTRRDYGKGGIDMTQDIRSAVMAGSPEEAKAWIAQAQETGAVHRFYKPCTQDMPLVRLHIYNMDEVEKYPDVYGYEVPADKTQMCHDDRIPVMMTLDYLGEN